ncbi:MAG: ribonuclease HI family protein [Candidatus Hermodarchaeota archaeon]
MKVVVYCDGASRGNPGLAGAGVVIKNAKDKILVTVNKFLGKTTNNVAEYQSVILGLMKARELGVKSIILKADSQLVINHLKGDWKVREPHLLALYQQTMKLLAQFDNYTLLHISREENTLADSLANEAIDLKS